MGKANDEPHIRRHFSINNFVFTRVDRDGYHQNLHPSAAVDPKLRFVVQRHEAQIFQNPSGLSVCAGINSDSGPRKSPQTCSSRVSIKSTLNYYRKLC